MRLRVKISADLVHPDLPEREGRGKEKGGATAVREIASVPRLQSIQLHASLTFGRCISVARRGPRPTRKFESARRRCVWTLLVVSMFVSRST